MVKGLELYGRQVIYTDAERVTTSNVVDVLSKTLPIHQENREQIKYLYNYCNGKQPILRRVKDIRPEILNKLVENRANEIVSFKTGFLVGEPIQYVNRSADEDLNESIELLNEYMFAENKVVKDKELAEWFSICGVAYRLILPDRDLQDYVDESPFEVVTLDPRDTYVVYHNGIKKDPVMAVFSVLKDDGNMYHTVYTPTERIIVKSVGSDFEVVGKPEGHIMGDVPIIEYITGPARLGEFEIVLPLLDAMNMVASNRLDGLEQFVQSLLVLKGVNLEDEMFDKLRELGGILLPNEGDAKYLVQELNQTQTQTIVDYMYDAVLTICGMPNRNGGSSTSDTGKAVLYRDGWTAAEARAKERETQFKESEKRFLKIAIRICNDLRGTKLKLSDIDIRFTRRNFENILEKAQVLIMLLSSGKVHPRLAFGHCGMFADPDLAYNMSREWWETEESKLAKELSDKFEKEYLPKLDNRTKEPEDDDVRDTGQDTSDNQ